jgi:hypothetical protein
MGIQDMLQLIHKATNGGLGHTTLVFNSLHLSCCFTVQAGQYVLQVSKLQAQQRQTAFYAHVSSGGRIS